MSHHSRVRRRSMHGLSLVELLVSLTIGLILMVAVVSAYLGSASASRMAEAQGRMNEDAQAALAVLAQQLRMAGNNPIQPKYLNTTPRNPAFASSTPFAIRGCDATFTAITTQSDVGALTCTAGSGPDSLAIRYEADQYNTVKNSASASTDCLGQAIPATTTTTSPVTVWDGSLTLPLSAHLAPQNVTYYLADNRFYIANASGIPNLYCKGNGAATPQPVVENIEDMQILYGTAAATGSSMDVVGYLTADDVNGLTTSPADAATRWSRVSTVRVCIVVRSEGPVAPDADSAQYYDCSGFLVTPTDLRLRRAYTTTVVLRNRVDPA